MTMLACLQLAQGVSCDYIFCPLSFPSYVDAHFAEFLIPHGLHLFSERKQYTLQELSKKESIEFLWGNGCDT